MAVQVPQRPSGTPDWLYFAIVVALGVYFIIGGIAWTMFIYNGVQVPDSFITLLATIAGGLVGVLAPTRGTGRSSEDRQDGSSPPE
jgi:drug/metabolite transporter (DMT)-like permease